MSKILRLTNRDVVKGLIMAVLTGVVLPIVAIVQTPGFDVFTVNWSSVLTLALNGAVVGFVSYMTKQFFSDSDGKLFGKL